MMDCPICAWTPDNLAYRFLVKLAHWRVVLAPNQCLLGRCVVHLKRHAGDLVELTQEELLEWHKILKITENALQSAFDATMFNWSCYMNLSYRENTPNPHIHWWAVPRYNHKVKIAGLEFDDPDFGNPYDHYRWREVPDNIHQAIADQIKQYIEI